MTSEPERPQAEVTPSQYALVETWRRRIQHLKMAHYQSCGAFEFRNKILGTVVITLSAAVGPATYLTEKLKTDDSPEWRAALVLLGLAAGIVATLQIFFRDSERAEKHRAVGATYAALEMDIERLAAFPPKDANKLEIAIAAFRDEWQRLTGQGPVIPQGVYKRHAREIDGRPHNISAQEVDPTDRPQAGSG